MNPFTNFQNAVRSFHDATSELAKTSDTGGEPAPAQVAEWCRLCDEMNAAAARAADAVPESAEDTIAKLEIAADAIEQAAFEDGDCLAARTREIAADLAGERDRPNIAVRIRGLLASCEYANLAFYYNHGFCSPGYALDHLRTALAGLTRLRAVA